MSDSNHTIDVVISRYLASTENKEHLILFRGKPLMIKKRKVFESEAKASMFLNMILDDIYYRYNRPLNYNELIQEWIKENIIFVPAHEYYATINKSIKAEV